MKNVNNNETYIDAFEVTDKPFNIGGKILVSGSTLSEIKVGQKVINKRTAKIFTIIEISCFSKKIEEIEANRICGIILSGAEQSDFARDDILQRLI